MKIDELIKKATANNAPVKLEARKYYVLKNGMIGRCGVNEGNRGYPFEIGESSYREDGRFCDTGTCSLDVLAEIMEPDLALPKRLVPKGRVLYTSKGGVLDVTSSDYTEKQWNAYCPEYPAIRVLTEVAEFPVTMVEED